jgi:hypothetical protein
MPTTNIDHTRKLIAAHRARLRQLELIEASRGSSTPPEITNEIEEISNDITKLEASLGALNTVETLTSATIGTKDVDRRDSDNYEHRLSIMVATVQATVAELSNIRKHVDDRFRELQSLIFYWAIVFMLAFVTYGLVFAVLSAMGLL